MSADSAWVLWALFNGFRFTSFFRHFVLVIKRFNNSPSKCSVFSVNFAVSHAATLSAATRQALSMVCQCCLSSVSNHIRSVSSITEETSLQSYAVFFLILFIQYLQYTSHSAQLRGKGITWQSEYYCTKNINLYRHTWINYFYKFCTEKSFQNSQPFHRHLQYGMEKQHEGTQHFCTSGKGMQPLLKPLANTLYQSKLIGSALWFHTAIFKNNNNCSVLGNAVSDW